MPSLLLTAGFEHRFAEHHFIEQEHHFVEHLGLESTGSA
jgi:hypothetical protein